MKLFIKFSLLFSIFLTLHHIDFGFLKFYYYYIIVFISTPILLFKNAVIEKKMNLVLILFLLIGIVKVISGENNLQLCLKVWLGIFASFNFYYYLILNYDYQIIDLFSLYIKGCIVVSIIGLVQFISYFVGFKYGYDYSWLGLKVLPPIMDNWYRVHSVYPEPAHFTTTISPAIFIASYNLLKNRTMFIKKWESLLVIIVLILSTSSIGYISLLISLMLIFFQEKRTYIIISGVFVFIAFALLFDRLPFFQDRIESLKTLSSSSKIGNIDEIRDYSGSSVVLYNNFHVALNSFKSNPLFGGGLGSHPISYTKYSLLEKVEHWTADKNKQDANSLFNRILSEGGFVGILLVFVFIYKGYIPLNSTFYGLQRGLISNSILLMVLLFLLRQGHYFIYGFPFFCLTYYYNKKYGFILR